MNPNGRGPLEIAPVSRRFLVELFTDLRNDLEGQMRESEKGSSQSDETARRLEMYEGLLAGLTKRAAFPDSYAVRQYVIGLAEGVDEANKYDQAVLEHRALSELIEALPAQ